MALFENVIRDFIQAQGFTDASGATPVYFVSMTKDQPDFTVTVLPEPGATGTKRLSEFPTFTIRVRHRNGEQASLFLRRIFELLQEFQGRLGTSPTWPVARISAEASPTQLGRDNASRQGRWLVSQTYNAIVRFTTQP